jgi:Zn-dependent alcohol dehydrogenase
MKAQALAQQKEPLRVEELEVEAPREGEVAVRMVASGVCHSCLF